MKQNGFSLIETIAVMTIFSIVVGLAVPSVHAWLEQARVEGQIRELYVDLQNARVRAFMRGRTVFVVLQEASKYAIYEDTNPLPEGDNGLQPEQDALILQKTTHFPLVPRMGLNRTTFRFTKNGLVSINGTIRVDSSSEPFADCVKLFTTRVLMGKWNGSLCVAR